MYTALTSGSLMSSAALLVHLWCTTHRSRFGGTSAAQVGAHTGAPSLRVSQFFCQHMFVSAFPCVGQPMCWPICVLAQVSSTCDCHVPVDAVFAAVVKGHTRCSKPFSLIQSRGIQPSGIRPSGLGMLGMQRQFAPWCTMASCTWGRCAGGRSQRPGWHCGA